MHSIKQNAIDASWALRNDNTDRLDLRIKSDGTPNFARPPGPVFFDDFLGDVLRDFWTGTVGSDTDAAAPAINVAIGGTVRLLTGNTDSGTVGENGVQLDAGLNWKAEQGGLVFETRLKLDVITGVTLFVGLTDRAGTLEMPMSFSDTDTVAATADDAVGFLFDTASSADNFHCVGVKATTVATSANSSIAPVAATYNVLRIEVDASGNGTFYIDGVRVGTVAAALTATVALTPTIVAASKNTTAKNVDVDYVFVQADRA